VERLIAEYTGVESIEHDMCPKTCLAYTGLFANLEECPMCTMPRWDEVKLLASGGRTKAAAQRFVTILLGSQLQSLYHHPQSVEDMRY
ncbi:hypothetical protein BDN67DRAFT_858318, partial [Paxillus ammoniavirescens]